MSSVSHFLTKSLISGATMSVASVMAVGRKAYFTGTLFNTYYELPLWGISGVVGAVTSVVADGLHTLMEENIPLNKKITHELALASGIGLSTGAFCLTLYALNPSSVTEMGLVKLGLMGALSEVVSSYAINAIYPDEYF